MSTWKVLLLRFQRDHLEIHEYIFLKICRLATWVFIEKIIRNKENTG